MKRELILRIQGTLAPNNKISLRTISHTLPHLQRAIDKIVLYEEFGEIKKHSALPSSHYEKADLFLDPFEEGSIKIPLIGDLLEGVGVRFNQFLTEPYQRAVQDIQEHSTPLIEQLENVRNNIEYENVEIITQRDLINRRNELERSYAQTAVLKDLNTLLSPLRAKSSADDTISITNNADGKTATYEFNHQNSKSFGKIVTQKRLSNPIIYSGTLEGLKKTGNISFPYAGNFISHETNDEMKLLVASEGNALLLNKYNLSKQIITIWVCPVAIYEAFDQFRGDIVFVSFAE